MVTHLYTSAGNQPFPVGAFDVEVLVVYGPVGGIGVGGGPGIWVDSSLVNKLSREQKATLKQYQSEYATLTKSITSQRSKIIGIVSKVTRLLGI